MEYNKEMWYYKISVPGRNGYSFMVCSKDGLPYDELVIELSVLNDLFRDDADANYAVVDDLVSEQDIQYFIEYECCYEI